MAGEARDTDKLIIGMSLVSTAVEHQQDVLEYFVPLVMTATADLCRKENLAHITAERLKEHIASAYSISIPLDTMATLVRRICKKCNFKVFEKGKSFQAYCNEIVSEIQDKNARIRKFNNLLTSFVAFAGQRGIIVTENQAKEIFVDLFQSHTIAKANFILDPDIECPAEFAVGIDKGLARPMLHFLIQARKSEPTHFETLRDIFLATSLIAFLECTQDINEPPSLHKKCRVYLDTNFVLRLLDWQTEYETFAAQELFGILKSYGADPYVFSFTLHEVLGALDRHGNDAFELLNRRIARDLGASDFGGITSAILRRRLTRIEFQKEMEATEETVRRAGIGVLEMAAPNKVELDQDEVERLVELKRESRYKRGVPEQQLEDEARHDIAAITLVRQARKERTYSLRQAKVWFLTCDYTLMKANREFHVDQRTLPESMMAPSMTNLLWLASPKKIAEVGVAQFISHLSAGLAFSEGFLRYLDTFIKKYVVENPGELAYVEDVYRSLQIEEKREELLALQEDADDDQLASGLEKTIRDVVEERKKRDEEKTRKLVQLEEVYEVLKDETKKELKGLAEENEGLIKQLRQTREDKNISDQNKRRIEDKLRLTKTWLVFLISSFVTILIIIPILAFSLQLYFWILPLIPMVTFYVCIARCKSLIKKKFFKIFFIVFEIVLVLVGLLHLFLSLSMTRH